MTESPDLGELVVPLIAGAVALGVTFVAARDLERRGGLGLLDRPGERKLHPKPVPLAGGIALLLGIAVVMLLARAMKLDPAVAAHPRLLLAPLGGFVVGLVDDLRGKRLGAGTKAGATLFFLACASHPGPLGERIGWIALAFVAMHALNTVDHVNGLAGFVAAAGALAVAAAASFAPAGAAPVVLAATVAGASAGFLFLNFPRGRVFLGDSGTLLLGGALAALLLAWRRPELLLLAAVPVADLMSVAWLRLRAGARPWVGDRRHVTHRLVARGMKETRAVIGLAMVQAGCSAAGACALAAAPALGAAAAWTLTLGVISALALGMLCVRPV